MSLTIEEYRCELLNKVLLSCSQEEVNKLIQAAIADLEKHRVNKYIIMRFVEKMIGQLQGFSPMEQEARQWSNIKTARVLFNQVKNSLLPELYH